MLLFNITPQEEKSVIVAGVKIRLYGELTVEESIAIDIENQKLRDRDASNTEYVLYQLGAWLSVRLGEGTTQEYVSQLSRSRPLTDTLWKVFREESDSKMLEVTEGKEPSEEDTIPLETGMECTLNSPITSQTKQDLLNKSLVVVD